MWICTQAFHVPKRGNAEDEYEDAFFPENGFYRDPVVFRCAVADGASESAFAREWAEMLVRSFGRRRLRLKHLQDLWRRLVSGRPLPWYLEAKIPRGSHAAFVGLSVAATGAFWYGYARPAEESLTARRAELATLRGEIDRGLATARQLPEFRRDVADLQAQLDGLRTVLPEERDELDRWMRSGWVDTFRHVEPEGGHYSWWNQRFDGRKRNVGWRIDYVLASQAAMLYLEDAFILSEVMGSDHCPVGVDLDPAIFG